MAELSRVDVADVRRRLDGFRLAFNERTKLAEAWPPTRGRARERFNDKVDEATFAAFVVAAQIVMEFLPPLLTEVEQLRERLRVAEIVCTLVGWTGSRADTDRGKALTQAWLDWSHAYGDVQRTPEWDARIAELAARRDEIRSQTLARLRASSNGGTAGDDRG